MQLLLDHYRIDPNIKDEKRYTILHRAIMGQRCDLLKLLFWNDWVNCNLPTSYGRYALHLARDPAS
jgi:Ankyrin repeats (many copies)